MRDRRGRTSVELFAVVTGGGTGGHVVPALAVAEALVERGHGRDTIHFVGARRGIEGRLVPEAGFEITLLPGRGIKRRLTLDNIGAVLGLLVACVEAVVLLARRRPRVAVTVGGFAGLPASLAAVVLRVPLLVVNVDAVPGASNRMLGRFARHAAVAFPGTSLPRAVVTGAPVSAAALAVSRAPAARASVRDDFGIVPGRLVLVAAGGSLGAGRINEAVQVLARRWAERSDLTILHAAGERNLAVATAAAVRLGLEARDSPEGGLDYRLFGYEPRLPSLLGACDLAVCRAGASTVAELTAIGTPSILVPLPGAPGDHQTRNAAVLARAGAALLLADGDCDADRLAELVAPLLADPSRLEAMGQAAAGLGRRDAADRIAALAESAARPAA